MTKNNSKTKKTLIVVIGIIAIITISYVLAFLTDTDTKTNEFTIGKVDIQIDETFDDTDAANMIPGDDVQKEVAVENIGENAAYVYLRVKIPTVTTSNLNDIKGQEKDVIVDAYAIQSDSLPTGVGVTNTKWVTDWQATATPSTSYPTVNELYTLGTVDTTNWTKINDLVEYGTDYVIYTYYYNTPLAKGATTTNLFTSIKFAPWAEVTSFAAGTSSSSTGTGESTTPTTVTTIPTSAIGSKVNYSVTVNGTTLSDWTLFYPDNTTGKTWIVYDGYLPNAAIDTTATGLTKSGTYGAYWNLTALTNPYGQFGVNKLMTASNWSNLISSDLAAKDSSAVAYGAVDINTWVNAWNAKGYTQLYTSKDSVGYKIGTSADSLGYVLDFSTLTGSTDTMFFPYTTEQSGTQLYLIGSVSAASEDQLLAVRYNLNMGNYSLTKSYIGIRPAICVSSSDLTENGTAYDLAN